MCTSEQQWEQSHKKESARENLTTVNTVNTDDQTKKIKIFNTQNISL